MVDLQDLSKSVAELQSEPITDIAIVSKKEAPTNYCLVAQTTDGFDADLWKDSIFKSKVKRYLCFTRASSTENVSEMCTFNSHTHTRTHTPARSKHMHARNALAPVALVTSVPH
uniref:MABP domain-containing protein n=1 Tax=Astyanax mexicanus TaxID=7994 RepID=A0A3B1JQL0_ASTMX